MVEREPGEVVIVLAVALIALVAFHRLLVHLERRLELTLDPIEDDDVEDEKSEVWTLIDTGAEG